MRINIKNRAHKRTLRRDFGINPVQLVGLEKEQHPGADIVHLLVHDNIALAAVNVHDLTALVPVVIPFVIIVGV
ncbi:hypothetical protein D3C75_1111480 [compost metagenome]